MMNASTAPDWRDDLIARHPSLFGGEPGTRSGRPETNDGWRELLEIALQRVADAIATTPDATLRVSQIKEKFGTLRLYYNANYSGHEDVRDAVELAIDLAEARSATTCETCGDEGRLYRIRGWLTTACPVHAGGVAVPCDPARMGLLIRHRYVDGALQIESCRRYDRDHDCFVDVDPRTLGSEDRS